MVDEEKRSASARFLTRGEDAVGEAAAIGSRVNAVAPEIRSPGSGGGEVSIVRSEGKWVRSCLQRVRFVLLGFFFFF